MSPSCYFPLRLFFDDAVVEGANGVVANNPTKITSFFENFFKDNQELRHLYCISPNSDDYETEWGVAGCKKDGKLFVFTVLIDISLINKIK